MSKKPMKYYVVDAFAESAFKGNPAAVCLLEENKDNEWLQALAAEFNISVTCYLTPIHGNEPSKSNPRFAIRWFTPIVEVDICGHATLAASHALFSSGLADSNATVEFVTPSRNLTAKKIPILNNGTTSTDLKSFQNGEAKDAFYVELNFPVDPITEFKFDDTSLIYEALKGASIIDIKRTQIQDDILVVVTSGKNVTKIEPQFDVMCKLPGRAVSVTGIAPPESGFDIYGRLFAPKIGCNEDPVCGSINCSLASYWSKKLGKCDLKACQSIKLEGKIQTFTKHSCKQEYPNRNPLTGFNEKDSDSDISIEEKLWVLNC